MNDDIQSEESEDQALRDRVATLRQEHQDLSAAIEALQTMPLPDQLLIARLKRRKLSLRDEIVKIEARILPDIIA